MRRLLIALAVGACAASAAVPAYAAGTGEVGHIEVTDDGTVQMLYSMPGAPSGTTPDLNSIRVSVAGKPVEASASPVRSGQIKRTAVLALDVSDSMRGDRFAAAKQAANLYLRAAPEDVAVGLVTFAGHVTVVDSPTTDHDALQTAVDALSLSRGTQLYDGVLESLVQAGSEGQRDVIVLSDGADTGDTPLGQVVSRAKESGVTVNVVALEQDESSQAALHQITDATSGAVLPADDPDALAGVFTREAEELASQVLVGFRAGDAAGDEATVAVSLQAGGEVYEDSVFVTLPASAGSREAAGQGPLPVDVSTPMSSPIYLYAGAGVLGAGLAVTLALIIAGRPREKKSLIERHLEFYTSGGQEQPHRPAKPTIPTVRDSAVKLAGQVVGSGGLEAKLSQRLTAAGSALTAAEWLLLHAGIAAVGGLFGFLVGGPVVMVALLAAGVVSPWIYLGVKRGRRLAAFNSQLAETLQLISGGLSAGLSMAQAVDTVVREGSEPVSGEMRRALVEQRLGVDIEDALEGVADRMTSEDFRWVVMAIRIQREVGGNLAELLTTVAATLRERDYLRRQVKVLSAEGRLSAWIIGCLPIAFVFYLALTNAGYLRPLYTEPLGLLMSAAGVVMLAMGGFWLSKMTKVEV
jgi:tight adherence protein B